MNMSSLMDRPPSTYLLMFSCFTFVCICGGQAFPSCEVGVMVQRGTTWKAAPRQRVTVECPVSHCGQSLNVTWCKLLDGKKCEPINGTDNVEIRQDDQHAQGELISFLTFKRISIDDDGLYRCDVEEYRYIQINHIINISVSDFYEGVVSSHSDAYKSASVAGVVEDRPDWLPYFSICASLACLVLSLTALTLLRFYGWKRLLNNIHTKGQEISTQRIPNLPQASAPSTPALQTHFSVLNDIYCPSTAQRPPTPPSQSAVTNTADENQAVYAVINHRRPGLPVREQHAGTKENKNAEYAAINIS